MSTWTQHLHSRLATDVIPESYAWTIQPVDLNCTKSPDLDLTHQPPATSQKWSTTSLPAKTVWAKDDRHQEHTQSHHARDHRLSIRMTEIRTVARQLWSIEFRVLNFWGTNLLLKLLPCCLRRHSGEKSLGRATYWLVFASPSHSGEKYPNTTVSRHHLGDRSGGLGSRITDHLIYLLILLTFHIITQHISITA